MSQSLKILVVEDNPDLAANLVDFLESRGHAVCAAGDGLTGLRLASAGNHDVIILDLVLPGLDGITLCQRLRRDHGCSTPILMLTARDSIEDKITGLEAGGDDYLVKPFVLREVEARLKALVRRASGDSPRQRLQVADLEFDTATYRITRAGQTIDLPPIPAKLLEALMRASPRVLSRDDLERAVWGNAPPDSDALRAHMHLLRNGIDKPFDQPLLHTLRGIGWQLCLPSDATDGPSP
jgi:DNA-binding response OmpR family regulator